MLANPLFPLLRRCSLLPLLAILVFCGAPRFAWAQASLVSIAPVPSAVSSTHFTVTINGNSSPVVHAVAGYYLLNFDLAGPAQVTVTASDPHYWDAGVEVQPMRYGIRPHRDGASISFPLAGPAKVSITRPNDHFGDSEMLFLFANPPDRSGITAQTPGIRYYGPGVHRENIDAHTGDHIYLAAGAVVFGSLNVWQVQDVHVSGRGMLIYDGPQDPNHDTGWIHKPNWHVIVMDDAFHVDIEGITAIVRSRTWMIQMRDTRGVTFRNVKVIGGSTGNANQDGMDWLGGGDALVQDSFIRAADDIFAMQSDWAGYSEEALTAPGQPVSNIIVENSVLSTSISNVVRANWPQKTLDSSHFTMRDSDVIHMGQGSCSVPFALLEIWADPEGKGDQSAYTFQDIRLEDWYSLVQLRQPGGAIRDVAFSNIAAMDGPGLAPSALQYDVRGVSFHNVDLGGGNIQTNSDIPLQVMGGAENPTYANSSASPGFTYSSGSLTPGAPVTFTAAPATGAHQHWLFGDGSSADGATVQHAFPDTAGTLLDGTGRFRVLLATTDSSGHTTWSSQAVVIAHTAIAAQQPSSIAPQPGLASIAGPGQSYQGLLRIPADGGYTLSLLSSTKSSISIDGISAHSAKLRPQVCGSKGDAVQAMRVSAVLSAGLHRIQILRGPQLENAEAANGPSIQPVLLWEGPGLLREPVPQGALFHLPQ